MQCSTAIGVAVLLPFLGVSSLNFGPLATAAFFLGCCMDAGWLKNRNSAPLRLFLQQWSKRVAMPTDSKDPHFRGVPPAYTIKPMDPPPMEANSTSAQLKGDIDSGRTGDKNAVFDPALSPLGTDDEAAGFPPKPEQVDLARRQEDAARWQGKGEKDSYSHPSSRKALYAYIGFIGLVLVVFVGAFSIF